MVTAAVQHAFPLRQVSGLCPLTTLVSTLCSLCTLSTKSPLQECTLLALTSQSSAEQMSSEMPGKAQKIKVSRRGPCLWCLLETKMTSGSTWHYCSFLVSLQTREVCLLCGCQHVTADLSSCPRDFHVDGKDKAAQIVFLKS